MHTLILGFDSFDPTTFERLSSQGKLPHLSRYAEAGKYARFKVSDPPQTEVSWTSIATGLDAGGHGIFDFVHRDPATYTPFVSLLPTQRNRLGVQFVPPCRARSIFDEAAAQGYPATSLWWPATFPARYESPVRSIPGLGTPDILGKLGVGTLYTNDALKSGQEQKTTVRVFQKNGKDRYKSIIQGPLQKKGEQTQAAGIELHLEILDNHSARLTIGKQAFELSAGKWSPIIEISFKMGLLFSIKAITRAVFNLTASEVGLYLLPLQIHPLSSAWRYATPPGFMKEIWNSCGPYLTLGWPQDTTGLEEGCINDEQFIDLCDSIQAGRERILIQQINTFDEGVVAVVFDCLDRVQHMFRRDRPDIVDEWYGKLDSLVGRIEEHLEATGKQKVKFLIVSDHGFSEFRYKVHTNRWLLENGFLSSSATNGTVNWSNSQAYAVGLNSLYINLKDREGQGSVTPDEFPMLTAGLQEQLLKWHGPDGRPVMQRVLSRDEAFNGPLTAYGPDLLLGFTPGYRASYETGLGKWNGASAIEPNDDHWGADHCIDSQAVPGVFFSSQGLEGLSNPSYRDIPQLVLGKSIEQSHIEPPPPPSMASGEGKEAIEERLKSLGYL